MYFNEKPLKDHMNKERENIKDFEDRIRSFLFHFSEKSQENTEGQRTKGLDSVN